MKYKIAHVLEREITGIILQSKLQRVNESIITDFKKIISKPEQSFYFEGITIKEPNFRIGLFYGLALEVKISKRYFTFFILWHGQRIRIFLIA
jgi:hypothetical protein